MTGVDPVVRVEGLTKDYGPVLALDSLTVDVTPGIVHVQNADERTWAAIHYEGPLVEKPAPPLADSRIAPRKEG